MALVIAIGRLLTIAAAVITTSAALFAVIALFGALVDKIERGIRND